MSHQQKMEKDELRARFTKWLETVIRRAQIDYLRKYGRDYAIISIEEIPENAFAVSEEDNRWMIPHNKSAFDFEGERLAKAFYELPLMRQRILTMLFVEEKKPEEIAKILHCSIQHVYNQRSLALKKLRILLGKDGDKK